MDVKSFPLKAKVWTLELPQLNVVKPEVRVPVPKPLQHVSLSQVLEDNPLMGEL